MSDLAAGAPGERIVAEVAALAEQGVSRIGRFLYPMRLVSTLSMIAIVVLAAQHGGGLHGFHRALIGLALVYPHLSRALASRSGRPRLVELGTSLVDDFLLGATVYCAGFSPVPTSSLLTIALANGMALGGVRMFALAGVVTAFGATVAMPFLGLNFAPREHLEVDLTAAAMMLLYFNLFAYTAWARSLALIRSRRNMRQDKLAAEIATKKAEALLVGALPPAAGLELARAGEVTPRLHEDAVLLAIVLELRASASGAVDPAALFADLNHAFKSCDAIALRHGVEPLRTTGTTWLGAGGMAGARARPDDVAAAALEMREQVATLAAGRDGPRLRAALHAGWVVGGVVETRKFAYDVWGPATDLALRLAAAAAPGEVWATAETAARLGAAVRREPLVATLAGDAGAPHALVRLTGVDAA